MQPEKSRLSALTLAALGIVYDDIGTSPLYSAKENFGLRKSLSPGFAQLRGCNCARPGDAEGQSESIRLVPACSA